MTKSLVASSSLTLVLASVNGASLWTQSQPPSDGLRFEVASVKPNKTAMASGGMRTTPDRLTASANPAFDLIRYAYQIEDLRIVGAPEWTNTERFDISATMPPNARAQAREMMRSLLAERFALKAHRETRPTKVHVLSRVRSDGRLGAGLRVSNVDCASARCFERNQPRGVYHAIAAQWPSGVLMAELRVALGTPLLDRTGLMGRYDIDLEWADPTATVVDLAAADGRPSIVTAMREQLGLKLEPNTEPMEVLIIDSIERPTPD